MWCCFLRPVARLTWRSFWYLTGRASPPNPLATGEAASDIVWHGPRASEPWSIDYLGKGVKAQGDQRLPHDLLIAHFVADKRDQVARLRHDAFAGRSNRHGYLVKYAEILSRAPARNAGTHSWAAPCRSTSVRPTLVATRPVAKCIHWSVRPFPGRTQPKRRGWRMATSCPAASTSLASSRGPAEWSLAPGVGSRVADGATHLGLPPPGRRHLASVTLNPKLNQKRANMPAKRTLWP